MHTVPGFYLLESATARSHSHSILSIVPAQTFVQPCWESDRGIDLAKNNFFFFQVNSQAELFLMWQHGRKWAAGSGGGAGREGHLSGTPASGYADLSWLGHEVWVFKSVTIVRILASFSNLVSRGSFFALLQLAAVINHTCRTQTNTKMGRSSQAWCMHQKCLRWTKLYSAPSLIKGAEWLSSKLLLWDQTLL